MRAAIIAGSRTTDKAIQRVFQREVEAFTDSGGKLVMISEPPPGISTVTVQNRAASRKLARKLVDLGHQEFVVLAGPSQVRTSDDRIAGFRRGLIKAGSCKATDGQRSLRNRWHCHPLHLSSWIGAPVRSRRSSNMGVLFMRSFSALRFAPLGVLLRPHLASRELRDRAGPRQRR